MRISSVALGCLSFVSLSVGQDVDAKKRPWDAERYSQCLTITGNDQLAPTVRFDSLECRKDRDPVESSEEMPSGAKVNVSVAGSRSKEQAIHRFVAISFGVQVLRGTTYVGGRMLSRDNGGALSFLSVYTMIAGQRTKLDAIFPRPEAASCATMRQGSMSMHGCSYVSVGVMALPEPLLKKLAEQYDIDHEANFRFRVEADEGSLTLTVPLAEIEAVRRKVYATEFIGG